MDRYRPNSGESDGKFVIVDDTSGLEAKASDIALEKSTESTDQPRGFWGRVKNFAKNVWKRSEVFQTVERHKAREVVRRDNSQARQAEAKATTDRFSGSAEFDEEFIHKAAGESKEQLGNSEAETRIKTQLQELIRSYARGTLSEGDFGPAKERIFAEIHGIKPEALGKGKMYADNLFAIARDAKEYVRRQVDQRFDHEEAIRALDLDFDVVIGKAKSGVRSEAQFNAVDRLVDTIQRGTGGLFNEKTVAVGVTVAYTLFTKVVQGSVRRAATVFGLGMAASGAVGALRESRKIEVERMQHAREKAQGKRVKNPDLAKRREELEASRIQTKSVRDLEQGLSTSLFDKLGSREAKDLTEAEYKEALKTLADINTRIQVSDGGIQKNPKTSNWQFWKSSKLQRVDLIGYSDIAKVEEERKNLDALRVRARTELQKWATAHGKVLNDDLQAEKDIMRQELFGGDAGITKQNEAFRKLKSEKVRKAFVKGAFIGGAIGLAVQEIYAFADSDTEGALEHGWHTMRGDHTPHTPGEHASLAEGIRRRAADVLGYTKHGTDFSNLHDQLIGGHGFKLPDGYDMRPDGHGGYQLFDHGHVVTDPFQLNPDGTLTPDATTYLADHGFGPHPEVTVVAGPAHAMTLDETNARFHDLSKHYRDDWHDNPGEHYSNVHNKPIEFEGKQQNLYLEQASDGVVSVNANTVLKNLGMNIVNKFNDPEFGLNPDGSMDPQLVDLPDKLLRWVNDGTLLDHVQVAIIPTEAANHAGLSKLIEGAVVGGKIALPAEYSAEFTDPAMFHDGHLPFKFIELRLDGHVLATASGADIEISGSHDLVNTIIGKPENPNFITNPPYIIPFGRRKGLEEMERRPGDIVVPPPVSGSESGAESGRESRNESGPRRDSSGREIREVRDLQNDIVEVYFGNLSPEQKAERLVLLQELLRKQTTPEDQRRLLQLVDDFYFKHSENLANKPFVDGVEADSGDWDSSVDDSVDTFPAYRRLSAQEKKERKYYLKTYLNKNRKGVADDKKKSDTLTVIRLLNIFSPQKKKARTAVRTATAPVETSPVPVSSARVEIPPKLKQGFEGNPLSYIYGRGLNILKQSKIGPDDFIAGIKDIYGIDDAEYAQIKIDAQNMQTRGNLSNIQKELALIIRKASKRNPGVLSSFKASASPAEYNRWVTDIVSFEAKGSLDSKTLDDVEIKKMAKEFGVSSDVIINGAVSGNNGLRSEASKRFGQVTKGRPKSLALPDNRVTMDLIQKQTLEEYQDGRLTQADLDANLLAQKTKRQTKAKI